MVAYAVYNQNCMYLTSQNNVNVSFGNKPLASSIKKSLLINFLKPQSLP